MAGHFKIVCIDCLEVISQCRCPALNKEQRFSVCPNCQRTRDAIANCPDAKGEA